MTDQQIQIFTGEDGKAQLEVALDHETVWLSQAQMAELFDRNQSVISRHVRKVFKDNELPEQSNMQKMSIAGSDKPVIIYAEFKKMCKQTSRHYRNECAQLDGVEEAGAHTEKYFSRFSSTLNCSMMET